MMRWNGRVFSTTAMVLGLLVGTATPALAQAADDPAVLRDYYSGNGFLNRGMYDLAAEEYRAFLKAHPSHEKAPVARYGLAVSLHRLGDHEAALPELAQLRRFPSFQFAAEVAMIEGQSLLALERYDDAAKSFAAVVERHPDHDLADDALAARGEALYRAGDFQSVADPCSTLVQRFPQSGRRERAELYWGLADIARGDFQAAAERFEGMAGRFAEGRHVDQTLLLLAQSRHQLGELEPAAQRYRQVAQRKQPAYAPDALYGLGLLHHTRGELDQAGRPLDDLLRDYGDDALVPDAHLLRGRVHFEQQQVDDAVRHFEAIANAKSPVQDDAWYWLAKCDLHAGDAAGAARRLQEAIRTFTDSELLPEMRYDRCVALLRADEADTALQELAAFRRDLPRHDLAAEALHLLAVTEHQQERWDQSLEHCRRFVTEHAGHRHESVIRFLIGENEFLAGRYDQAEKAFSEMLTRFPKDAQVDKATFRLGMAVYHQGDLARSEPVLDRVLDGAQTKPSFRAGLLALGDGHFQAGAWAQAEQRLVDYVATGLDQPATDDALLKLGLARQRQENLDGAIEAFDRLIAELSESPHVPQAVFERGQALVAADRPDDAAEAFERLLAIAPDSRFAVHARNHLGALAMSNSDFGAAAGHFAAVAEREGGSGIGEEALYQQGQALMAAERFEEAATVFSRLQKSFPSGTRLHQAAALEAIGLARHGSCEVALQRTAAVEQRHFKQLETPLAVALLYEKAWCQREAEASDAAMTTYRTILQQPGETELHRYAMLELAELEFEAGEHGRAAEQLDRLRGIATERPKVVADALQEQATYRLGVCRYHLDDLQDATKLLEELIERWPKSERVPSASLFAGEAHFKLGAHRKAITHLDRVAQQFPDDAACDPAMLRLGEALALVQDFARSEQVFRDHRRRFPDAERWYQAQFGLGWALENQGKHDEAVGAYGEVIERHQGSTAARAQFQIGQCMYAQRRFEQAARELLKVDILYAYPEWSAAALYEAGRCFQELSNPVDARAQFEKVVQEHATTEWAQLATQRLDELAVSHLPGH